ncbi:toxin-antitoxin system, antitoxin component, Xre domain protein [Anaeroglobus geminatus F0357]|uniref:Toxin-antitoxin system, antitoxin component, Xre domain protein n=1 Tax=Anaeroglobus geminatus F0357 TaxID=861450 RepID=G9YF34_9FIRM|nr:toxin-antitoxin system, antitoxin component, Xre domain protein [Anaeroglobus geminatus F0357]
MQREREAQGRTLTEVSAAVYIKTEYLSALEADNYDSIPGAVFVKGFIRAYAGFLGLDGEELIETYLRHTAPEPPVPERRRIGAPKFAAAGRKRRRKQTRWPEITIIGGLVLFILLMARFIF